MGREVCELNGDENLQGLPPNIQRLMRYRKFKGEENRRKLPSNDLRRKYPLGGYCAICGKFQERIFPQTLELSEKQVEKLRDHSDKVLIKRRIYWWARNPQTWKKIPDSLNQGVHHVLYETSFESCHKCSSLIARRINELKRDNHAV